MRQLDIKETQAMMFDALRYLDEICRKYQIRYFLAYGSLLGAVREHDFIPWDDDVDVWMEREDYNRFSKIMSEQKNDKYFFQDYQTDPLMPAILESRICINHTINTANSKKNTKYHSGISIDIFPLDNPPASENELVQIVRKLIKLNLFSGHKYTHVINKKRPISYIFHFVLKLTPKTLIDKKELQLVSGIKDPDTTKYYDFACAHFCKSNELRLLFDKEMFADVEYIDFHGMKFPCPVQSHALLRQIYGDNYMTPIQRVATNKVKSVE